jgi:excisionase family DNA binding protein
VRKRRQPLGFVSSRSAEDTTALFTRIPARQAAELDRLSFELKVPKQEILSYLLARHLDALPGALEPPSPLEIAGEEVVLGRHSFRAAELREVLTLTQAAELLQAEEALLRTLAEDGSVPGRLLGEEWRFSRHALLAWLSQAESKTDAEHAGRSRRSKR